MFSISFAITYIVILTCVMFLNLIISLSVLWIDNDIIAYIALQKQPLLFRGYLTTKRGLFYSPFFCYHSISLYVCKSIYFFMTAKIYAVFFQAYTFYTPDARTFLFQYQFLDRHKRISLSLQFINNLKCCIY